MSYRALVVLVLAAGCRDPEPPPEPPPPPPVKLTEQDKAAARTAMADARTRLVAAGQTRDAAFAGAAERKVSDRPCPVTRSGLGIADDIGPNGLTVALLGMTRRSATGGVALAKLDQVIYEATARLDKELASGVTAESFLADLKTQLAEPTLPAYELALILTDYAEPTTLGNDKFRAGAARGALYLFSAQAGRVICAAAVAGESSSEVTVSLNRDLARNARDRQALTEAHLAGELLVRTIDDGIRALVATQ